MITVYIHIIPVHPRPIPAPVGCSLAFSRCSARPGPRPPGRCQNPNLQHASRCPPNKESRPGLF
eukprot:7132433-Pyramimonas_sp.AAC.1